jgi:hypothetical protein
VPALWGLQEFDAFLLIVDGVPYGGAFNPALPVLDLRGVERIEVLRGAAPVTYGATSFVGVIQVFHYGAGQTPDEVGVGGGDPEQATAYAQIDLPGFGNFAQSLALTAEHKGFAQSRSELSRLHALYRLAGATALGALHLDLQAVSLRQDPYSPHPREGASLTLRFPFDANVNPLDAKTDQDRAQANIGLASDLGLAHWETTLSGAYTLSRNTRGFLRDGFAEDGVTPNADGFRGRIALGCPNMEIEMGRFALAILFGSISGAVGLLIAIWFFGYIPIVSIPAPYVGAPAAERTRHAFMVYFWMVGALTAVFALVGVWGGLARTERRRR